MCARQTIERRGSQFAQDRKRSSQDQQHGWSKENVRKVASLQSVVSCGSYPFFSSCRRRPSSFISLLSLHSSLFSIRTFFQNSTQNSIIKKKKKKNKVILLCVNQVVSCLKCCVLVVD